MQFKTHYYNQKTKKMACDNHSKSYNQYRDYTYNKSEVTCKHCLDVLKRWAEIETKKKKNL